MCLDLRHLSEKYIGNGFRGKILSLAFDLVMIRSLFGTIRSPFTIVCDTRWSFKLYSFESAITLFLLAKNSDAQSSKLTSDEFHHNQQNPSNSPATCSTQPAIHFDHECRFVIEIAPHPELRLRKVLQRPK